MADFRAFLYTDASISGDRIVLNPRESHHLSRVLRARAGQSVEVLDGRGTVYEGCIEEADSRALALSVTGKQVVDRPGPDLVLLQSLPKGKTMDLILRIATEIGVRRVLPVFTEHGEVQLKAGRLEGKVEKWRLTMVEACKQCGLPFLPDLIEPVGLAGALDAIGRLRAGELRVVASLEAGTVPLREALGTVGGTGTITAAVGPEGDFSASEYAALRDAGFQPVRLGANVLRAETAAAYILSVADQLARSG